MRMLIVLVHHHVDGVGFLVPKAQCMSMLTTDMYDICHVGLSGGEPGGGSVGGTVVSVLSRPYHTQPSPSCPSQVAPAPSVHAGEIKAAVWYSVLTRRGAGTRWHPTGSTELDVRWDWYQPNALGGGFLEFTTRAG